METLSTSTSTLTTFQVPKPSILNHHPNLKPPISHHNNNHPSSFSTLQQKDTFTPLNINTKKPSSIFLQPLTHTSTKRHIYPSHRSAASGYAAALLDVSQCNGNILKVERDVRRVLKVLRNGHVKEFMMDDLVHENEKGKVVIELLEKGKFEKSFVGLVKLVVDKGKKVEFVKEVLEEFLRVFSLLSYNNVSSSKLAMRNT